MIDNTDFCSTAYVLFALLDGEQKTTKEVQGEHVTIQYFSAAASVPRRHRQNIQVYQKGLLKTVNLSSDGKSVKDTGNKPVITTKKQKSSTPMTPSTGY